MIGAGFLSALGASAQTPPSGPPRAHLADLDANHDGAVTRAEFDAGQAARFARLDANHDGRISAEERAAAFGGAPQGGPRPQGGPGPDRARGPFNPDANNDGVISRAEFDAQSAAMFAHLDADHDGRVTQAEIDAARPHRD